MVFPTASQSFHRLSKQHTSLPKEWPSAWTTTFYKEYPRLETLLLPDTPPQADLFGLIQKRASRREYRDIPLTRKEIGVLLKYACGNTFSMDTVDTEGGGRSHRAAPSGGARFPIEAYLFVLRPSDDLPAGVYHYRIREHLLEVLEKRALETDEIHQLLTYEWAWSASVVVVLTAVFRRTQDKYGERGYRYILLEAGHITQNICLVGTALDIAVCPLAGTRDTMVEKLLSLDGVSESLIYAIALGK